MPAHSVDMLAALDNRQLAALSWVACSGLGFLALVMVWGALRLDSSLGAKRIELAVLQRQLDQVVPETSLPLNNGPQHKVAALGGPMESARVLALAEAAAARSGATVLSLVTHSDPNAPHELGRLVAALVAQGDYAAIKRMLGELLARSPTATVARLHLQRGEDGSSRLKAEIDLSFWSSPSHAPALQRP